MEAMRTLDLLLGYLGMEIADFYIWAVCLDALSLFRFSRLPLHH